MLRCPRAAAVLAVLARGTLAGANSAAAGLDRCEVLPAPPVEHSLMQRGFSAARAHDEVPGGGGGEPPVSLSELSRQERELDRLAAQLEARRAALVGLRGKLAQEPGDSSLLQAGGAVQQPAAPGAPPAAPPAAGNASRSSATQERVIVPVPFYIHDRKPKGVPSNHGGGIFGDPLEPHKEGGHDGEHSVHSHSHVVILFLFAALVIGGILQILLDRYAPSVPYTCALFIVGMFVSTIHVFNTRDTPLRWGSWYTSIEMWEDINPHLLFYTFLPALLFGDVMKLKVQLVAVCSGQIFLLACPGVLMGTALTALVGRFLLPYGWDWPICLVFGSILSATDPVAVVSLFNTLGVSPRLTMLISGESLANDGTAIVCFALALKLAQGATLEAASVAYFFVYMIVPAIVVGFAIGFASVALIGLCSEAAGELDAMIQVVVTIACGYLAFFISEHEFSSSGVIATVSSGLAVAHSAWPLFVSKHTIHIVWEAIEFIGNTIIFFLSGLIFMDHVLSQHFGWFDFTWLIALYGAIFFIRAVIMCFFWIPLNMVGQPVHWPEAVSMVWSGLRGAVSLAMGMIVDIEPGINNKVGAQVMFHVGGIAALTLIVNSVTSGPLLRALGLVKTENMMNRVSARLSDRVAKSVKASFEKQIQNQKDVRFYGANAEQVKAMVPILQPQPPAVPTDEVADVPEEQLQQHRHNHLTFLNAQVNLEWKLVQVFREVFLRVVQSRYWQGIEDGVIPRQLMVSRILLHSTEEALDNTSDSLKDWDIIAKALGAELGHKSMSERCLSRLGGCWPINLIPQFRGLSLDFQVMMKVFVALTYIEAHTFAQEEIPLSLGRDDALDVRVQRQVIHESNLQKQKAQEFVALLPADSVELGKSEMLARKLLRQHISEVEHKEETGFLTRTEKDHLCEPCRQALRDIAKLPSTAWRDIASKDSPGSGNSPRQPLPDDPRGPQVYRIPHSGQGGVPVLDAMQPGYSTYHTSDPGAALLPGAGIHSRGDH